MNQDGVHTIAASPPDQAASLSEQSSHEPADTDRAWYRRVAADHPGLVSWPIVATGLLVWVRSQGTVWFYRDALNYWVLQDRFPGVFSLLDFRSPLRGYSFPMVLSIFREGLSPVTTDASTLVGLLNVAVVSLFLCFVVPGLCRQVSRAARVTVPRILLLSLLFWLSWRQDLVQPLTDIPSVAVMALAVLIIIRYRTWWSAFGAGLLLGLGLNFRPGYTLAAVAAVSLVFLVDRTRTTILVRMAAILVGIAAVLSPQVVINVRGYQRLAVNPVQSGNMLNFLMAGLKKERYDTYVGATAWDPGSLGDYRSALWDDLGGTTTDSFDSYGAYGSFVARHPLSSAEVYGRHVVNGLDTRFGGTYVEDTGPDDLVSLLNSTVLVAAVGTIALRKARNRSTRWRSPTTYFVGVLVASAFPSVLGGVEVRFLIGVHTTLIAAFALCASVSDLPGPVRPKLAALGSMALLVAACFALTSSTMSSLVKLPLP